MNTAVINLIGLAILLIGMIMHIVSMALPNYAYANLAKLGDMLRDLDPNANPGEYDTLDMRLHFGLFRMCAEGKMIPKDDNCVTFSVSNDEKNKEVEAPDWLKASQAMSILGLLFVAAGMALCILSIFKQSRGDRLRLLPAIIGGLCIFGAVLCIIGDIVYGAKYKEGFVNENPAAAMVPPAFIHKLEDMFSLDWAFAVDIAACVLFMVGGAVQMIGGHVASSNGFV